MFSSKIITRGFKNIFENEILLRHASSEWVKSKTNISERIFFRSVLHKQNNKIIIIFRPSSSPSHPSYNLREAFFDVLVVVVVGEALHIHIKGSSRDDDDKKESEIDVRASMSNWRKRRRKRKIGAISSNLFHSKAGTWSAFQRVVDS